MADKPVYLTNQTEEDILGRMKESISADFDKSEGGFVHDFLAPAAIELTLAGIGIQEALRRGFASTVASTVPGEVTEELTRRAAEHGVIRKNPVKAQGKITFEGTQGAIIPLGTSVSTENIENAPALVFLTTESGQIDETGTATVTIEAVEAGTASNVESRKITYIGTSVPSVSRVYNLEAITGGADIEDDLLLLPRYLAKVRNPSAGGNKADYVNWALEVPGVGAAKAIPTLVPGTVRVIITDIDKQPPEEQEEGAEPDTSLMGMVSNHIEAVRPIGATIEVIPAKGKIINITAEVILLSGYNLQDVLNDFKQTVIKHFQEIVFSDNDVSYGRIGVLLFNTPGIDKYRNLALNGGVEDIEMVDEDEIPVLGNVGLEV